MNDKKKSRMRRARRTRSKISELGSNRLCVNRTPRHIYAQVISSDGGHVLASASTLDSKLRTGSTGNVDAAKGVGLLVAERAKKAGILTVAFDRSGYKYHGRVKVFAETLRKNGMDF